MRITARNTTKENATDDILNLKTREQIHKEQNVTFGLTAQGALLINTEHKGIYTKICLMSIN